MHKDSFEKPNLEPKGGAYRLTSDWHTDCKGCLTEKICVPEGYITDGASIPRFLWPICGTPMDAPRIYAAIVHDYLYSVGGSKSDRKHADALYRDYQIAMRIPKWKAKVEYLALRMCGWTHWPK